MEEATQGNPKAENMFGSEGGDFFDALEADVNGAIQDDAPQMSNDANMTGNNTPDQAPNQATQNAPEDGGVDWQKRYQDSSREAQRLNGELKNLKPFLPVLNAMRNDSGLVDHVRNYLVNGGAPTPGVAGGLNLPEDFQFNPEDLGDANSDSSKVLQAQIDAVVNKKVGTMLNKEKAAAVKQQKAQQMKAHEVDFKKRHNMDDASFEDLKSKAAKHILSLDDIYYILNRDKTATNVANNTKKGMMKQMENVNNLPGSKAAVNSQGTAEKSPESDAFDQLLNVDQGRDNLFG
ncbi:MAG: hypothetical protein GOVbin4296_63 [Prokaryotic dsDNA virus sp.]|nr:MAG: hypothetical protein GOVbin4296_63 [Prokaryotic dsDNA virus sp.]|tara:strand:+ start:158 stop:1030 length:873 start_codon:yes stop_codon:yes gene_type:complete